jgi:hypothetical protein
VPYEDWLSLQEVADALGLYYRTVFVWVRRR